MTPEPHTIEVDIMMLFNQINVKLDALPAAIALKADSAAMERLRDKLGELEAHGTHAAQSAERGVQDLEEKISSLGWRVAISLVSAALAIAGTVFISLKH